MARSDKVAAVAELANRFSSSAGVVLTEYRGLSVKALKELRRSLGDEASYSVSKNTSPRSPPVRPVSMGSRSISSGRRRLPSSTAIPSSWPKACVTSPGRIRNL